MNCSNYGRYDGKYDRCLKCEYKKYCMEAKELPTLWSTKSVKWRLENTDIFKPLEPDESLTAELLGTFSTALLELQRIRDETPVYYTIIMCKILSPGKSYNDIAIECKCTKQNVHQAIKSSIAKWPSLKAAILVNQKFYSSMRKRARMKPPYRVVSPISNDHTTGGSKLNRSVSPTTVQPPLT